MLNNIKLSYFERKQFFINNDFIRTQATLTTNKIKNR